MNIFKIGNIIIDSPVVLAPMAGVTNRAYREIVRELGAGLICSEMVNDKAILHGNERTLEMAKIGAKEHPISLQIFGNSVETIVEACKYIDKKTNADIIDINMGCPAPKITKNASGSKILLNPELVFQILSEVVKSVEKPVTVKMRIGWDDKHINIVENAQLAEKAGVKAIIIHGRTTKQFYSGTADWKIIKEVKESINIPVIGNGDIDSPEKAKEMLDFSKVDGIMIGRAAIGNPWIFKRTDHYLKTGILLPHPTIEERVAIATKHLEKLCEYRGEQVAVKEMRGQISWYVKGIHDATSLRQKFQTANTKAEMCAILETIKRRRNE